MPNTQWRIAYGDYDFAIDRQTLAYSLTETKTGTVWADGLSTGWIELEERESGVRTRYNFADAKLISVAEKSSHQGKRILFGLDLLGIPIDLYFICSEKEIQLTVEANRDTRTHKVQDVGLLPGLVSVPDDGESYLVIPRGEGELVFGSSANEISKLIVWDARGLIMPFVGAVRGSMENRSTFAVITDSAYAAFMLEVSEGDKASITSFFERDPERRRLDVRVVPIPGGDYISVGKAYREKLIADRNHVTLRRKIRDRPELQRLIGTAQIDLFAGNAPAAWVVERLLKIQPVNGNRPFFFVDQTGYSRRELGVNGRNPEIHPEIALAIDEIRRDGYLIATVHSRDVNPHSWRTDLPSAPREELDADFIKGDLDFNAVVFFRSSAMHLEPPNRWDDLESRLERFRAASESGLMVGAEYSCDWAYRELHFTTSPLLWRRARSATDIPVPLLSSIYRDCIISYHDDVFLNVLLRLGLPRLDFQVSGTAYSHADEHWLDEVLHMAQVLLAIHYLTYTAFLTLHQFVTKDRSVEEATYSDRTFVIINKSAKNIYERAEFDLPPQGFYVRHAQMEAHYALRVGDVTFDKPAWRIRRSQDGRPLETSDDIIVQEFPV